MLSYKQFLNNIKYRWSQNDVCIHQFAGILPVIFQNLRSPSQTGDSYCVAHQQSSLFCCQLNIQLICDTTFYRVKMMA